MALTVTITQASPGSCLANRTMLYAVTVTNTSSSAVTLNTINLYESTESDAQVGMPQGFLTPNVPPGTGNPVLAASASGTYMFPVVFNPPVVAGAFPNNQPGGNVPPQPAQTPDAVYTLQAQASASDGSIGSATLQVSVQAVSRFGPPPEGGGFVFTQGNNLINGLILGFP